MEKLFWVGLEFLILVPRAMYAKELIKSSLVGNFGSKTFLGWLEFLIIVPRAMYAKGLIKSSLVKNFGSKTFLGNVREVDNTVKKFGVKLLVKYVKVLDKI